MATVSVSVSVPAAPERTWATAADLSRFGEWLVLHEGWRGEVPGEIAEGVRLTSVVRVKGFRNRIAWLVEDYDPPRSLRISGRGIGGTRVSLVLSVRGNADASEVEVNASVSGPTTIGPIGMVIGRAVRGELRRSAAKLADLLG
jgi:hypothetical protein